jgi:cytochrome c oxidase subunit IV
MRSFILGAIFGPLNFVLIFLADFNNFVSKGLLTASVVIIIICALSNGYVSYYFNEKWCKADVSIILLSSFAALVLAVMLVYESRNENYLVGYLAIFGPTIIHFLVDISLDR